MKKGLDGEPEFSQYNQHSEPSSPAHGPKAYASGYLASSQQVPQDAKEFIPTANDGKSIGSAPTVLARIPWSAAPPVVVKDRCIG